MPSYNMTNARIFIDGVELVGVKLIEPPKLALPSKYEKLFMGKETVIFNKTAQIGMCEMTRIHAEWFIKKLQGRANKRMSKQWRRKRSRRKQ